ncbi:MAG: 50S ribosomal protein L23 [Candidatus Aenigmarchaeota archaeon]|nr:50S ribosomal protein L23 [Candidatus Aenigmarchaeota archaeon]
MEEEKHGATEEKKKTKKFVKKPGQKTEAQPKERKIEKKSVRKTPTKNEWGILSHPLMTEKSIGLIEKENKLVFVVNLKANKVDIKYAMEKVFDVKVDDVTTSITRKGQKKAFIKLSKDYSASEIATRLGML